MARAIRHILLGMGHLFDFSGYFEISAMKHVKERRKKLPKDTNEALSADIGKVGNDLQNAIANYKEHNVR